MLIGQNDEAFKQATFVLIERHFQFAAPFEALTWESPEVTRKGKVIGKFRITVEKLQEDQNVKG